MPKENELDLKGTVNSDDKVRIVTKDGLSQSIEVDKLKSSLSIDTLSGKVSTLEDKATANDTAHGTMDSRLALLESAVGDEGDGETELGYGLVKKVSDIESDLAKVSLTNINLHGTQLSEISKRITLIDGTNGRLDVLESSVEVLEDSVEVLKSSVEVLEDSVEVLEDRVEDLASTKLDASTFQSAVDVGFKITNKTPTNPWATGEPGEVCCDTEYFYVCVAANTWKRIPFPSW